MSEPETTPATEIDATVEGIPPRGDLVREIKALVEEQSRPQVIGVADPISGAQALIVVRRDGEGNERVEGLDPEVFDDYLERPRFRRGTANLTSLTSFIAHVNRFKDEESIVFACDDRVKPSLTAVLDYSPANREIGEGVEKQVGSPPPRFGRHRSHFTFPLSDEWQAWNKQNGKPMEVGEFALFLEDRIGEIAAPGELPLSAQAESYLNKIGGKDRIATPSDLVTLSKGLRINENAAITNEIKLSSGEGQVSFSTEHTGADGLPLTIPTSFQIAIPVFRNGDEWAVLARLRYRVRPSLVFWFDLWRTDLVFDAAFTDDAVKVADETGLSVLLGSPEA